MTAERDKAKYAEYQRAYKERHPDRVRASDERYSASEAGREVRRRAQRAWKQRNWDRALAHNNILRRVRRAVEAGRITKTPCAVCGSEIVQGHHYLGYAPEHELDVVWLCSRHHRDAHRPEIDR